MVSKKRILIITPGFYPLFGGMEEQCYIIAQEFIQRGFQVDLLTERTERSFKKTENIDGINVFRMSHIKKRSILGLSVLGLNMTNYLIRNRSRYDFCMIRTVTFPALITGLLKLLKVINFPTFVTADTGGSSDDVIAIQNYRARRLFVYLISKHNYLNSICNDNYQHYIALGLPKKKLTKIYNGIDVAPYQKSSYPQKVNSFLFLGRLSRGKGIRELLESFKVILRHYPDKKLYIGGEGEERDWTLNFIDSNKLSKSIKYLGFVTKEQKELFYKKGDCLILPSYSEGFPISILEAAARKKLIISTDVSDLKELFGTNIIFAKKKSISSLVNKIEELCSSQTKPDYSEIISKVDVKNIVNDLLKLFIKV